MKTLAYNYQQVNVTTRQLDVRCMYFLFNMEIRDRIYTYQSEEYPISIEENTRYVTFVLDKSTKLTL